jgi:hypothetical protein
MVSTVKQVTGQDSRRLLAEDVRQVVAVGRGAGSSPCRRIVVRIAVAETRTPRRNSSPWMRW